MKKEITYQTINNIILFPHRVRVFFNSERATIEELALDILERELQNDGICDDQTRKQNNSQISRKKRLHGDKKYELEKLSGSRPMYKRTQFIDFYQYMQRYPNAKESRQYRLIKIVLSDKRPLTKKMMLESMDIYPTIDPLSRHLGIIKKIRNELNKKYEKIPTTF